VYNRGVVRIRQGETDLAVEDLQTYLASVPNAVDAILVSQWIGQLQVRPGTSVSPGTALGLGLVLPGMGQFYSGRARGGVSVLALAGGALAAGFLIEKTEVRCVGTAPSGGKCPADRIISEKTTNPFKVPGLAAAGVIMAAGAVEAYLKARRIGLGEGDEFIAVDAGPTRILGPSMSARGPRLQLNMVRVTF
jgi:hypothetical protein